MANLTKEYFDRELKKLASKDDLSELARMVNKGFDSVDEQLAAIVKLLDVRKDVDLKFS